MGFADTIKGALGSFMKFLPEGGNKQTASDEGNVSKTSPTLFDYDVFRINWAKVATLQEIDEMIKADPRLKRANHVFASTAVRRGLSVNVSSSINESLAEQAQELIDDLIKTTQLNSKLLPWARSLLKDGELFWNPIVDTQAKKIIDIKNLPAITMQRNENIKGRFVDERDAFRQIDPVSREIIQRFALWEINHIRHDHEPGQLYGNSQYLACRGPYRKLEMTEQDLVVRRRTRAVPRRLHNVGNKDNPGSWDEVKKYKSFNRLDNPKNAAVTTDYYGNGLTDVKDLNGDAQLDHIKDIEHIQEIMMIGTGVPLHILGFGANVNRDIVEDQKKQFDEDVQELRDLLEYGDESGYSGLRAILDLQLWLNGIDPTLLEYNFIWAESNNETVDNKVDRVIAMRSSQPDPLISRKFALTYLGRDIGLENEEAIDQEIETIQQEQAEAFKEQQQIMQALNPENPTKTGKSSSIGNVHPVQGNNIRTDSASPKNPLHSEEVATLEKELAGEVTTEFRNVFQRMKDAGLEKNIRRIVKLQDHFSDSTDIFFSYNLAGIDTEHDKCDCSHCQSITDAKKVQLHHLVEQHVIDLFDEAWTKEEDSFKNKLVSKYGEVAVIAFDNLNDMAGIGVAVNHVHTGILQDLGNSAKLRIDSIKETTKNMLAEKLAEAYENRYSVKQWMKGIQEVMDIPDWRANMIARTELAFAYNRSNDTAYEQAGVTRVKYLAVMDRRTCPACGADNGKTFDINDVPSLPRHPRCRCTTIAVR